MQIILRVWLHYFIPQSLETNMYKVVFRYYNSLLLTLKYTDLVQRSGTAAFLIQVIIVLKYRVWYDQHTFENRNGITIIRQIGITNCGVLCYHYTFYPFFFFTAYIYTACTGRQKYLILYIRLWKTAFWKDREAFGEMKIIYMGAIDELH